MLHMCIIFHNFQDFLRNILKIKKLNIFFQSIRSFSIKLQNSCKFQLMNLNKICIIFVKNLIHHNQQKNLYIKLGEAKRLEFQLVIGQNTSLNIITLSSSCALQYVQIWIQDPHNI